ncbi:hypothetical protein OFN50_35170, partial [Escherichia coli]|nr:hypothetical protein [Escherichia coli]
IFSHYLVIYIGGSGITPTIPAVRAVIKVTKNAGLCKYPTILLLRIAMKSRLCDPIFSFKYAFLV